MECASVTCAINGAVAYATAFHIKTRSCHSRMSQSGIQNVGEDMCVSLKYGVRKCNLRNKRSGSLCYRIPHKKP